MGLLLLTVTHVSTSCTVVIFIFSIKMSCITSVDVIKLWLYWLIAQLSHAVIGRLSVKLWCYWLWRLVMSLVCFDWPIVTFKQLIFCWCSKIHCFSELSKVLALLKTSCKERCHFSSTLPTMKWNHHSYLK